MTRLITLAGAAVAMLAVAGCGSAASVVASPSAPSASPPAGAAAGRGGTAGEVVNINGTTLTLNTTAGDVKVTFSATTPIQKTSTGNVADIVPGTCIIATGSNDAGGTLTAASVRLSTKVNGTCTPAAGANGTGPGAAPGGGTRSPRPGQPAFAAVRGEVTAVSGTLVTVQTATSGAQTVNVPTTVRVARSAAATAGDITVGDCVLATGSKDAAGAVAARAVSIVPAGPSGCSTATGRGFRGGATGGGAGAGAGVGVGAGAASGGSAAQPGV